MGALRGKATPAAIRWLDRYFSPEPSLMQGKVTRQIQGNLRSLYIMPVYFLPVGLLALLFVSFSDPNVTVQIMFAEH